MGATITLENIDDVILQEFLKQLDSMTVTLRQHSEGHIIIPGTFNQARIELAEEGHEIWIFVPFRDKGRLKDYMVHFSLQVDGVYVPLMPPLQANGDYGHYVSSGPMPEGNYFLRVVKNTDTVDN